MHDVSFSLVTRHLPVWFLLLGLIFPRIALLARWWQSQPGSVHSVGLIPLITSVIVPRLVILYLIYNDAGISGWFLLHAVALVITWGGVGGREVRRRRRRADDI